jgi:SM-20-related protein
MKLVLQQPEAREIRVKLILAGGQSAMITLPPGHPLLAQLLAAVSASSDRDTTSPPALFQIPLEGGRASIAFASRQLIAVVTDPAVLVQPDQGDAQTTAMPAADAQGTQSTLGAGQIVRHAVVQLEGFLTNDEQDWLRDTVFAAQPQFQSSWTEDNKADYRQSMVLDAPADVARLIAGKIRAVMPDVMATLKLPPFPLGRIECQVTAGTDGSYFHVHTDSGNSPIDATRQLSYVYYFHREPKGYEGGELRVYDDQIRNGKLARTDSFRVVLPDNNKIVFFHSAVMHEVTPVRVPSGSFRDSRFTVNGWIHRA